MSYEIYIFHSSVKDKIDSGIKLDAFEHCPIETSEISLFIERLHHYGYKQGQNSNEFFKNIDDCPIQVHIFNSEISFSVPYQGSVISCW